MYECMIQNNNLYIKKENLYKKKSKFSSGIQYYCRIIVFMSMEKTKKIEITNRNINNMIIGHFIFKPSTTMFFWLIFSKE